MSVILVSTVFYKALILQGEIWCWSLLGLKGLRPQVMVRPKGSNLQPPSLLSNALPTDTQANPAVVYAELYNCQVSKLD